MVGSKKLPTEGVGVKNRENLLTSEMDGPYAFSNDLLADAMLLKGLN